jgi:lipopolysaccharide biosynthesis glycosyltransferase
MSGMTADASRRCFALIASRRDRHYLESGTLTTIRSIKTTNPGVPIVVLHHDLDADQQALFAGTILKQVERFDFQLSDWSRVTRPVIPDTCYLAACVELIEDFVVAVYIDADTVVLEPVDELFQIASPVAARVMDDHPLHEHFEDGPELLRAEKVSDEFAMNNGLVCFDLRYWRAHSIISEARRLFATYGPDAFRLTDQSLVNLVAYKTGGFTPLSRIYNFCRYPDMLRMEHSLERNRLGWMAPRVSEGLVKIVHWTGPLKPWDPKVEDLDDPQLEMCLDCYQQFAGSASVR